MFAFRQLLRRKESPVVAGEALFTAAALALGALFAALFLTSLAFLAGWSAHGWVFWLAVAGGALAAWRQRCLQCYTLVTLLALVLTAFTYTYWSNDSGRCFFPMQCCFVNGWNPVWQHSREAFEPLLRASALVPPDSYLAGDHILFLPHLSALAGALVALATGLYCGDAYFDYLLVFAVWIAAVRFARRYWTTGPCWCHLFAAALIFTPKLPTGLLAGFADSFIYLSFLLGALAAWLWTDERSLRSLMLLGIATLSCCLIKPTGIIYSLVFLSIFAGFAWVDRLSRRVFAGLIVVALVMAAAPYLTNLWNYGSIFYPVISHNPAYPAVDLTADFVCNADGARMGYLARICNAWISPALARWACAHWYGLAAFDPQFKVFGGVEGLGTFFRALLLVSALMLALSRKRFVPLFCLGLFAISNLAPLKFVGYSRYFPCIWAIVPVAFFHFAFANRLPLSADRPNVAKGLAWLRRCAKYGTLAVIAVVTTVFAIRMLAYQGRMWGIEREGLNYNVQARESAYPICNSLGELWRFPWANAYQALPPIRFRSSMSRSAGEQEGTP